jgi:para-nitrobenzyl esterase
MPSPSGPLGGETSESSDVPAGSRLGGTRLYSRRMEPIVTTTAGQVRGATDGTVLAFKGIPFAAPPVGSLRFRPPQPAERWDGVRDATRYGNSCPQPEFVFEGSPIVMPPVPDQHEDCLQLNIWTPEVGDARLPVMVWIHGGAFIVGTAAVPGYDGTRLARRGVVVVTVNYRLGAFGYLHLEGEESAGNAGTLDQVAALEWVQENIAAFGGDPGRVTIFGESAGGMCVGTLLAVPAAEGLFHRAIAQSGAASTNLAPETARRVTQRFGQLVGVDPSDREALEALDVAAITGAVDKMRLDAMMDPSLLGEEFHKGMAFLPVHGTPALPRLPLDAVKDRSAVALITGTTADEMRLFTHAGAQQFMFTREVIEIMYGDLFGRAGRTVRPALDLYARNRPGAEDLDVIAAFQADLGFRAPAIRLAEAHVAANPETWMYRFSWPSPVMGGKLGACHGLEISFVFGNFDDPVLGLLCGKNPPLELADQIQHAWVSFATDGVPQADGLPGWPRYDTARRATMDLNVQSNVVDDPEGDEREVWDGIV